MHFFSLVPVLALVALGGLSAAGCAAQDVSVLGLHGDPLCDAGDVDGALCNVGVFIPDGGYPVDPGMPDAYVDAGPDLGDVGPPDTGPTDVGLEAGPADAAPTP